MPKILQRLCEAHQLGMLRDYRSLPGTRNQNYLIDTSAGRFFVRQRYAGYCDPARMAFDHAALDFLYENGVPVARLREGDEWEIFDAVQGRHFQDRSAADVKALANALREFHRVGANFPQRYEKLALRGETDPSEMFAVIEKIRNESPSCAEALGIYENWINDAAEQLSDELFQSLPKTLIHGDIQPANILINDGKVAALVDLDWCAWLPRIYDLGFAILMCCAIRETPINGADIWSLSQPLRVDGSLMREFLDAYGPLSPLERDALRPQIMLSWCSCRVYGVLKVEPERRAEFLSRAPTDVRSLLPDD